MLICARIRYVIANQWSTLYFVNSACTVLPWES